MHPCSVRVGPIFYLDLCIAGMLWRTADRHRSKAGGFLFPAWCRESQSSPKKSARSVGSEKQQPSLGRKCQVPKPSALVLPGATEHGRCDGVQGLML
eukprot:scaffold336_cov250-Pinguiococcus_pyrenoidosus.AAC.22